MAVKGGIMAEGTMWSVRAPASRRLRRGWIALIVVVILVATGAAVLWFGVKKLPGTHYAELDETDQRMFTSLSSLYEQFQADPAAIWSADYRFDEQPLTLIRRDEVGGVIWHYAYLVNMSDVIDTAGMQKVDLPDGSLPDDVRVTKTLGTASLPFWAPFNFTIETLGETPVLTFKYSADILDGAGDPSLEFGTFLLHEAFHVGTQQEWTYDRGAEGDRIFDYPTSSEQLALLRTEFAILDSTTGVTDPARMEIAAHDLAQIRIARYEKWPELRVQDNTEAIEGTARYVERRMSDLTHGDINILTTKSGGTATFVSVLDYIEETEQFEILERDIAYETGAQLGYMLDVIEPTWKQKIEPAPAGEGLTPFQTLQRRVSVETAPTPQEILEIQSRYP